MVPSGVLQIELQIEIPEEAGDEKLLSDCKTSAARLGGSGHQVVMYALELGNGAQTPRRTSLLIQNHNSWLLYRFGIFFLSDISFFFLP